MALVTTALVRHAYVSLTMLGLLWQLVCRCIATLLQDFRFSLSCTAACL